WPASVGRRLERGSVSRRGNGRCFASAHRSHGKSSVLVGGGASADPPPRFCPPPPPRERGGGVAVFFPRLVCCGGGPPPLGGRRWRREPRVPSSGRSCKGTGGIRPGPEGSIGSGEVETGNRASQERTAANAGRNAGVEVQVGR